MVEYVNEDIKRASQQTSSEDRAGVDRLWPRRGDRAPAVRRQHRVSQRRSKAASKPTSRIWPGRIKLAQAALPEDSAGRVVIICDGNENLGERARTGAAAGRGGRGDRRQSRCATSRAAKWPSKELAIPPDVNHGQPFDLRVVLNNTANPASEVRGRSRASCKDRSPHSATERKCSKTRASPSIPASRCSRSARRSTRPTSTPTRRCSRPTTAAKTPYRKTIEAPRSRTYAAAGRCC